MTADVTREPTGGQELREAIARTLYEQDRPAADAPEWDHELLDDRLLGLRTAYRSAADAVLALPEVAALIADGEKARNLRELHTRDDTEPYACDYCGQAWPCDPINALDGEDPT